MSMNRSKPVHDGVPKRSVMAPARLVSGMLLIGRTLVLTGCYGGEIKQEIWLRSNERWKADFTVTLSADERARFESKMSESEWEELIEAAAAEGVSLNVSEREEPDGGISYLLKTSGRGLSSLNENCFDGNARISKDDEGHIHISWAPGSSEYGHIFRDMTVIMHGSKIISSNGDMTGDDSVTWRNPSRVVVELAPRGFPFIQFMAVSVAFSFALGFIILSSVGLLLLVRKQESQVIPC